MAPRLAGILCGGNGTRLWPLSREKFPKQFHDLAGTGQPLLIDTLSRVELLQLPIVIITGAQHGDSTKTMLSRFNKTATVVGEPVARDTAAAVALLTLIALRQNPDTVVGSFHADHVMKDTEAFREAAEIAYTLAEQKQTVVTIAITPTFPSTAYGYLDLLVDSELVTGKRVARFIEKPDLAKAEALIATGNVAWNAGMFFFPAKVMAQHFATHLPELWSKINELNAELTNLSEIFAELPKIAIDFGIMEKISGILAVPYAGDWADVGSWEDVVLKRGAATPIVEVDGSGSSYISVIPQTKRAVFLGVDNLIAVDTPDALLIMRKGSGQGLKKVVEHLRTEQAPELKEHTFEERPWGRFEVLLNTENFKSKRLLLLPGKQLSYQRHKHRTENWTITRGEGTVTLNDIESNVKAGDHITITAGTKHRLKNHTNEPLEFIEVQTGTYFGEDDIERFADEYGRV
ncbi:MAG TPA: sugar phosphate nucleotidyltransferase [bacterium]|nr:sugar phosphate nucleotidyltransferase [bacterium]